MGASLLVDHDSTVYVLRVPGEQRNAIMLTTPWTMEELSARFPRIAFEGKELTSDEIYTVVDILRNMQKAQPTLFGSLRTVELLDRDAVRKSCGRHHAEGCASVAKVGKIVVGNTGKNLLVHEIAHALTLYLWQQRSTFETEWTKIAEDPYGIHIRPETCTSLDNGWRDTGDFGPDFGCVSSYGCKDYLEDVAEFTKTVFTEPPDFFLPLLAASNSYRHRYRGKLDLLVTYGFISRQQYDAILRAAKAR